MLLRSVLTPFLRDNDLSIPWYIRVWLIISVGLMQLILFYATYYLYHIIPYSGYLDLETWLDHAVPYIEWSWIVYYFGFIYIIAWGSAGVWNMSPRMLWRTILLYMGLVVTGAILRLILPSDSPWPLIENLSSAQRAFKTACNVQPLGGFPSMHAAMAVLPAFIGCFQFRSMSLKLLSGMLALAVCTSVVTAKEHWAIDVPAGMLLGLFAGIIWYRWIYRPAAFATNRYQVLPHHSSTDSEFS